MNKLTQEINKRFNNLSEFGLEKFIVSCADEAGEGEKCEESGAWVHFLTSVPALPVSGSSCVIFSSTMVLSRSCGRTSLIVSR